MSFTLLGILQSQAAAGGAGAYDLLETQVLSSSASSVTFTGLDSYSDYKHLQIRLVGRVDTISTPSRNLFMKINGSTTNYDFHYLQANGSSVSSGSFGRTEPNILVGIDSLTGLSAPANAFGASIVDILDFSNTNKNTTVRSFSGESGGRINLVSGLYNQTTAVNSLEFFDSSTPQFVTGSRFSLYGIKG